MRIAILASLLLLIWDVPADARTPGQAGRSTHRSSSQSFRRRLHVNSLVTDPGTFEWEWASYYDPGGDWLFPTTWKITPGTGDGFWGRTELSAGFDVFQRIQTVEAQTLHGSDHLLFAMTTALPDWGKVQWAVAPTVNFFLRDNEGARVGGLVLGKLQSEDNRHQGGIQISWDGATHPSSSNPAGTFDAGGGYGYRLGNGKWMRKFTASVNVQWERSTSLPSLYTLSESLEFQANDHFAIDVGGQHLASHGYAPQHILVLSLTWNLGRFR